MMDGEGAISLLIALIGAALGGGGFWAFLSARAKQPADMTAALAAYQEALANQSKAFQAALMEHGSHLQSEVNGLRAEVARLARGEAECQARSRQLEAGMKALIRLLRNAGIDLPGDVPLDRLEISEEDGIVMFQGRPVTGGFR